MYFDQSQYFYNPHIQNDMNYNMYNGYNQYPMMNNQIQQQLPEQQITPQLENLFTWSKSIKRNNGELRSVETAVINFLMDYFNYTLDYNDFLSIYDDNTDSYNRISYNKKFFNTSKDACLKSKKYIWFNPIFDFTSCRFIFDRFLSKNNIDVLAMYISDNELYFKDYDGNIIYKSKRFNHNQNLCYLDIIFRLSNIYIDLSVWDIEIDNIR